jgi:sulfite exporter TauE/SafE
VLLAAAVSGNAVGGSLTMIAFGIGTMPAMLTLSYLGARLGFLSGMFARLVGCVLVACGPWTASMPAATLAGLHDHMHHHQSAGLPSLQNL